MRHRTLPRFWRYYGHLPKQVQKLADKNFELLKSDPHHPSLPFKRVGKNKELWSVRVGDHYRAVGTEKPDGIVWFWIGTHEQYERMLAGS